MRLTLFYYVLLAQQEEHLTVNQNVGGSIPSQDANEVMAMRGSRIAKQIIDEQRREAKRKQVLLELRKRLLKERGESNGDRSINKETTNSIVNEEYTSENKY